MEEKRLTEDQLKSLVDAIEELQLSAEELVLDVRRFTGVIMSIRTDYRVHHLGQYLDIAKGWVPRLRESVNLFATAVIALVNIMGECHNATKPD